MDFAFPLMPIISSCENSPCVQTATKVFLQYYSTQESNWINIGQPEMRKDKCMPGVVAYEEDLMVKNY